MYEPKGDAIEMERKLREVEARMTMGVFADAGYRVDREIEICGETAKVLRRMARMREDLEAVEAYLELIEARVCHGEVPEVVLTEIRDGLDSLEFIIGRRGRLAEEILGPRL